MHIDDWRERQAMQMAVDALKETQTLIEGLKSTSIDVHINRRPSDDGDDAA